MLADAGALARGACAAGVVEQLDARAAGLVADHRLRQPGARPRTARALALHIHNVGSRRTASTSTLIQGRN